MIRGLTVLCLACSPAFSQDVFILGEVHDNPAHHVVQAERVAQINPAALVFEMLTPEQAKKVTPDLADDENSLARALQWEASGWPDFSMYYPIFASAPMATVLGAHLPRSEVMEIGEAGSAKAFGDEAERYGLDHVLPAAEQSAREALQFEAHCRALPEEMLSRMVDIQRLRDAVLARAVIQAMEITGGPVVVITGNGHARRDWGVPAVLGRAAPDLEVWALGQAEGGVALDGEFDEVVSAEAVARPDPCAAFE